MVQQYGLREEDFRGEHFQSWSCPLKGCNDLLVLTRPEIIEEIHSRYLEAGAEIISTDSFNANAISLADYGLEGYVREITMAAARTARRAADRFTQLNPSRPRFVAGSMGPTNRSLSLSADIENPAARELTFEELSKAYYDQASGLLAGGVDLLLVETVFDTLNAKAALFAISQLEEELGRPIEVMLSGTLTDSGRTLSGQTVEAFVASLSHFPLLSIGFNCAFGAKQLLPYLERLAEVAPFRISAHPNAGLPNVMGGYDETPEKFAQEVEEYLRRGLCNIVGGCCGTTPEHILQLRHRIDRHTPRPLPDFSPNCTLSGLESLIVSPELNFINVGERTNVAGSAKFARLIREERYEEALSVARDQVEAGAQIIDVCMDDGMIDSPRAMQHFLNLVASEPEIARRPIMIDSSNWEVLEAGLRVTQGKSIVNSLSLKEGEERFKERALCCRRYGAAIVVMLFDEQGQADTFARKIEVAERAYRLLLEIDFPKEDIIFDPNILAVGTGIEAHDRYALDFIEATRWIKSHCPGVKISGGVSNLSFAFRGNNPLREAMHSAFLYHAIKAGMDMGIVNPQLLQVYSTIEPKLLEAVEDLLLYRRRDAAERLSEFAQNLKKESSKEENRGQEWRNESLKERIRYAMLKGVSEYIEGDAVEAYHALGAPMAVIDTLLMPAMEEVGELFGRGKMFLPQVVKSARVMKGAVSALTPWIEAEMQLSSAGKVLLATVKGDVHDIGKNIVSVVMACGGYRIYDLGVMVEPERIVEEALRLEVDAIGLSGLITPSLEEMIRVCKALEERGAQIPVIVGGATTSDLHTALKMAPHYSAPVIHAANASENVKIMAALMGEEREEWIAAHKKGQEELRQSYLRSEAERRLQPIIEVRKEPRLSKSQRDLFTPLHAGRVVFSEEEIAVVEPLIDWNFFFHSWGMKGHYPALLDDLTLGEEARKLHKDALAMLERIKQEKRLHLQGVVGLFEATVVKEELQLTEKSGKRYRLPMLRNQTRGEEHLSVLDFISTKGDWVGCFALSAGIGLQPFVEELRQAGDDYSAMMAKLLADRLTEAFAEYVHRFVRREMWGYAPDEQLTPEQIIRGEYRGLRMAFGYPATPDHALKRPIFDLLRVEQFTAMRLTENFMIDPGEALCGLMLSDGRYFSVGKIDQKQLLDYARSWGVDPDEIRRRLPANTL